MQNCDTKQTLIPIKEAIKRLLMESQNPNEIEIISLFNALGRVLAEDILSAINVPPADNSAMDGYAINSTDLNTSGTTELLISQRICAGSVGSPLKEGTAARIFTGAPIPKNADIVIMQEVCNVSGNGKTVTINNDSGAPTPNGMNIRRMGEDIHQGDTVLKLGTKLKPQDVGLAASIGIAHLKVYRRLHVAIFSTGDELREPEESLEEGQIYNSNRYTMRGLLESLGCDVIDLGIIEDSLNATKDAMLKAASEADLIMTSGGVSVGEEDHIRTALEEIGQLNMWRINVKPGKPLAFGKINNTHFLGMPGNPVSVFATFCLFARPFILKKQGVASIKTNSYMIPATFEWNKKDGRCEYLRAHMQIADNGKACVDIYPNQSSGVLTSTSWANGFAVIQPNTTVAVGDNIEFIPFAELFNG